MSYFISYCKLLLIFDRDIFVAGSCKRLWALLPFWHDVLCAVFSLKNKYIHIHTNLKIVVFSSSSLKICSIRCQKFKGSRDLGHVPFG